MGKIAILPPVEINATVKAERPPGTLSARPIGSGVGWAVSEFICTFGPGDRPFEESHAHIAISAVVSGSFRYRTSTGRALLHPGAFLLGNAGACYECGHDHGGGDRCIAFHYEPALFEEIAATAAGSSRYRFPVAMLPARREFAALVVDLEAAMTLTDGIGMDELSVRLAERVLGAASGVVPVPVRATARDQRRIGATLRYIEANVDRPLDLEVLSDTAFMSKYHFLRTFRNVVGVTPHQFLLGARLRRAALTLRATSAPVAAVALDAGFNDLSTFGNQFRTAFGVSPNVFRQQHRIYVPRDAGSPDGAD